MSKSQRIVGIYNLVSGLAMPAVWGVLWIDGNFLKDKALLVPEILTIVLLVTSGLALLRGKNRGEKTAVLALGLLLYAVVLGACKYALAGQMAWSIFFLIIAMASAVMAWIQVTDSSAAQ